MDEDLYLTSVDLLCVTCGEPAAFRMIGKPSDAAFDAAMRKVLK